jgi:hypothetical protein
VPDELQAMAVWVRGLNILTMNSRDHDQWESDWAKYRRRAHGDIGDTRHFDAFLLTRTLCDGSGALIFQEADIPELLRANGQTVSALGRLAGKANGIFQSDLEEMIKNFEPGRSGSSGSGSPTPGVAPSGKPSLDAQPGPSS